MEDPAPSPTPLLARRRRTYVGRDRALITAGYVGSFFAIGVCLASLGPLLPELASKTGRTLPELSFLFVARSIGYVLGSLLGGVIFDRVDVTHAPLVVGNLLCALGCATLPSLSALPSLAAAISTQGACMGLLDTGGNVLLIWLQGPTRVELYMQAMHAAFAIGAVASPLFIEWALTELRSFAPAFYSIAAFLALCSLPLATYRGPLAPAEDAAARGGGGGDGVKDRGEREAAGRRCAVRALVCGSALCLLFAVGAEVTFGGFATTFGIEALAMSDGSARGFASVFWGGLAAGRIAAVPAAARLSPATVLGASMAGRLVFSATACLPAAPPAVPWVAAAGFGFSLASIFPTVLTHAERATRLSGRVASLFVVSAAVGELLMPLCVALLFVRTPAAFPRSVLAACVAQTVAFGVAHRAARRLSRGVLRGMAAR